MDNQPPDQGKLDKWIKAAEEAMDSAEQKTQDEDAKVKNVIVTTATICAGIAIQPIPFADIFILTPIQSYMILRIGKIKGFPISKERSKEILMELAGAVGLGFLAQQTVIGLYKFIPFLGPITSVPMVFGITYGIGRMAEYYFEMKKQGMEVDGEALKTVYKEALKTGAILSRKYKHTKNLPGIN